ncbi:unnamed protein product [Pocillopora meandrina]|uniref:Uncharacterized protein n=1 Tax=Pocillopora meandrina TaxID=46732 RepID=A0AAU9W176_9CNID|nr:unnamed protein product [Pocillopora meandrina]
MVQCHLTTSTLLGHKRDRTSHLPIFWDSKRPLVNRDTLALPLKEGGFNIPRLETKIQALRINTIKRLLSGEQAHWKSFTAHFFSISNIRPGKLALAMDYKTDQIDWNIPAFHKELLSAWHKYAPIRPAQIYPSLLLMSLKNRPICLADWVKAGIIRVADISYEVGPGFLPTLAIYEILADTEGRTLLRTTREHRKLLNAIPCNWKRKISN